MDTLNVSNPTGWDSFWMIITILTVVYEIVIRYIPTVKDYTILGFAYKILDWLVENRAKLTPEEEAEVERTPKATKSRKRFTIKGILEKVFN